MAVRIMDKSLTTRAAFSSWEDRIAPVFDVAHQLHVVEVESGKVAQEDRCELTDETPAKRAIQLSNLGIGTLVCGAISRPMHEILETHGIRIVPFVTGSLSDVIQAWLGGKLDSDVFAMPGCWGLGHRRHWGMDYSKENMTMNRKGQGGTGAGRGGGRGKSRQRMGRMGGPLAAGPQGYCVCPQCGRQEPHQRGTPCVQKQCPVCGIAMTRQ